MEANVEDHLNELDANELTEAVDLSATADEEVAGLANPFPFLQIPLSRRDRHASAREAWLTCATALSSKSQRTWSKLSSRYSLVRRWLTFLQANGKITDLFVTISILKAARPIHQNRLMSQSPDFLACSMARIEGSPKAIRSATECAKLHRETISTARNRQEDELS